MDKSPFYRIQRGDPFSIFGGTIKTGHMKRLIVLIIALVALQNGQAQLLKKIKDKAQQTVDNSINKVGYRNKRNLPKKTDGDKQSAGSDKPSGGKAKSASVQQV
jgi:hypothetical protein